MLTSPARGGMSNDIKTPTSQMIAPKKHVPRFRPPPSTASNKEDNATFFTPSPRFTQQNTHETKDVSDNKVQDK